MDEKYRRPAHLGWLSWEARLMAVYRVDIRLTPRTYANYDDADTWTVRVCTDKGRFIGERADVLTHWGARRAAAKIIRLYERRNRAQQKPTHWKVETRG